MILSLVCNGILENQCFSAFISMMYVIAMKKLSDQSRLGETSVHLLVAEVIASIGSKYFNNL